MWKNNSRAHREFPQGGIDSVLHLKQKIIKIDWKSLVSGYNKRKKRSKSGDMFKN